MWLVTLMGLVLITGTVVGLGWFLVERWWERRSARLINEVLIAGGAEEDVPATTMEQTPVAAPVNVVPTQGNSVSKTN
jgi:hypothetical protein